MINSFVHLAVFVPGYDVVATYNSLLGLHRCDQTFRDRVTVHLVYPLSHSPAENTLGPQLKQALGHQGKCEEFLARLDNNDVAGEHNWNYANIKVNMITFDI